MTHQETFEADAELIAAGLEALAACQAVLEWARTPGKHGVNPYCLPFVKLAEIAVAMAERRQPETWAGGKEVAP